MDRRVKERLVGATILMVLIVLIVPELLSGPKARVTPSQPPSAAVDALRNVTVDLATSKATPAGNTTAENSTAASDASRATQGATATGAALAGDAASGSAASGDSADTAAPPPPELPVESAAGEAAVAPAVTGRTNHAPGSPTIATLKAQQPAHSAQPELESEPMIPRSATNASNPGNGNGAAPASLPYHHWAVQLGSFASRANAEKLVRQRKSHDVAIYVSPSGKGAAARYRVRVGPFADRDAAERMVAKLKKAGQPANLVPP